MKKIIALSVLSLTVLLATACGTTTDTENPAETKTAEIGSCMVSANGSCQDYENLNDFTVENLESDCKVFGTWSASKCPAEYVSSCKTQSQGISGTGTYDLITKYKKDNPFYSNVKNNCKGEWVD